MINSGQNKLELSRIGLGCGHMSNANEAAQAAGIAAIHAAFEGGINHLNTADIRSMAPCTDWMSPPIM
ncbi:hypothetical protein [Cohnella sp. AR92]|uniref:hypothetical protein n=1 Tax=Cohnella sp. AR92 TaxID=648716 RepID=UPI001EDDA94E|nr:hypothetical protein [Cohnella sp. AR92]